jgi:hypothetical protein
MIDRGSGRKGKESYPRLHLVSSIHSHHAHPLSSSITPVELEYVPATQVAHEEAPGRSCVSACGKLVGELGGWVGGLVGGCEIIFIYIYI